MKEKLLERFLKFVVFETTSDATATTYPSTQSQWAFGKMLMEECNSIGLQQVQVDDYGYVTAVLPSNVDKECPTAGFVSHMDTSPQFTAHNVKPQVIGCYDGNDIPLPNGTVISVSEFPSLRDYIGNTLVTTDGNTLLGADDKAGICEILTAMEYLIQHPEIPHGKIMIGFTPDEEIGRGVDHFNVEKFGADFAYTVDGGALGELEYESFNAAHLQVTIHGKSVHPGTAKGIMVNASEIAAEIIGHFPKNETPQTTEGYEGFYHLTRINGDVSKANFEIIIRDFERESFEKRKAFCQTLLEKMAFVYGDDRIKYTIQDQYFNMGDILKERQDIVEIAKKAMESLSITPLIQPIRGGTDGSRLTFMGLPSPNLFTGAHNFHGPYEFVPVESMVKATEVIVQIATRLL